MVQTPELRVDDEVVLRPATHGVLVAMFEAYQEDSEAAQTALPWLYPDDDVRRQLRDMLYDIEAQDGDAEGDTPTPKCIGEKVYKFWCWLLVKTPSGRLQTFPSRVLVRLGSL